MTVAELARKPMEGGQESLPALDKFAEGMRRDGQDVLVVYVVRDGVFRIVPREQAA